MRSLVTPSRAPRRCGGEERRRRRSPSSRSPRSGSRRDVAKRTRSARPETDGQVRDIIEVLLGTAMRPGEVLALRPCDIEERPPGWSRRQRHGRPTQGQRAERQPRPKTEASIRRIPVPEFAAVSCGAVADMPVSDDPDHLRQPQRRSAQPVQRPTHVPRLPSSPVSATPASACAGTDAPGRR